jgi:phospholipid transport system substrate-binding protein
MNARNRGLLREWPRALTGAMLLALAWVAPGAASEPASATVDRLHAVLLEVMQQGRSVAFDRRQERVSAVLQETFDFPAITRAVLGQYADGASPQQLRTLQTLMERLSAVSYASQFDSFDGERFELLESRDARGGRQLVRTRLVKGEEAKASFDYVLQPDGPGWRIVNVLADGVSDLSLKRAQYSAVIRSDGLDVLLQRIDKQITDLLEEAATSG